MGPFAPAPQPVALPDGTARHPDLRRRDLGRSLDGWRSKLLHGDARGAVELPRLRRVRGPLRSRARRSAPTEWSPWCGPTAPAARAARQTISCSRSRATASPGRRRRSSPSAAGNHVIPGIAADPARPGRLALAYYTDSGRKLGVGFVSSADGGATWSRPVRLSPERMSFNRVAQAGGAMVGDYISTSFADGRAVPVFTLAQSPLRGALRQATYASSLPVP